MTLELVPEHDCDRYGHTWVEQIQVVREVRWIYKRCEVCYMTTELQVCDE